MARENNDMTVNQAGQKGGDKVRELIEMGKTNPQAESQAAKRSEGTPTDPVAIIEQDHRTVEALFAKFEGSSGAAAEKIAKAICDELEVHANMEEKFFYPVVRREAAKVGKELVQDGLAEHKAVKDLIARLRKLDSQDAAFAEVVVLIQKNVEHHVEEEEEEMLPLAKECIDAEKLAEIGNQMAAFKERMKGSIH